ncbi:hypothetical protein BC831DRAFT_449489 [Entophlyctis helioformis]|nr:hypothetical protein BC831DRAFT_449489 [Entophlyctis helioformis]
MNVETPPLQRLEGFDNWMQWHYLAWLVCRMNGMTEELEWPPSEKDAATKEMALLGFLIGSVDVGIFNSLDSAAAESVKSLLDTVKARYEPAQRSYDVDIVFTAYDDKEPVSIFLARAGAAMARLFGKGVKEHVTAAFMLKLLAKSSIGSAVRHLTFEDNDALTVKRVTSEAILAYNTNAVKANAAAATAEAEAKAAAAAASIRRIGRSSRRRAPR